MLTEADPRVGIVADKNDEGVGITTTVTRDEELNEFSKNPVGVCAVDSAADRHAETDL